MPTACLPLIHWRIPWNGSGAMKKLIIYANSTRPRKDVMTGRRFTYHTSCHKKPRLIGLVRSS